MIEPLHVLRCVVRPVLAQLAHHKPAMASPGAEAIVLGTMCVESEGGRWLKQVDRRKNPVGPALGPWQIEPATAVDIVDRWALSSRRREMEVGGVKGLHPAYRRPELARAMGELLWLGQPVGAKVDQLCWNLGLGAAICRCVYWTRVPGPLPEPFDGREQGKLWKAVYNTAEGKGAVQGYLAAFEEMVLPVLEREWPKGSGA